MGNNQSELQKEGYTVVIEQGKRIVVKDKNGNLFIVKKLKAKQDVSGFLQQLKHPHIVPHKQDIKDRNCLYLILEHSEGGDLTQKIKLKTETTDTSKDTFSETEILDWTVKLCMALKYLHDKQILHKNLQPKSIFFTACGTIRLGEFGAINEWSIDVDNAETKDLLYVPPEILSDKPYDEKSEVWSLGCVIYEMCMLKCAFKRKNTVETISKILSSSYEALPETFSESLRELVKDTLQVDPANRPSASEILTRPFIIKHLYKMGKQTIEELYKTLDVLEELAAGLEKVHFNTTVGSLAGGVIGLVGGILSVVGLALTPVTLGASLIVTGVGIGVSVAGGVTAGVSNVTKMVNQHLNRHHVKMIITMIQEKIMSTSCCIQNIQIAVGTQQKEFAESDQSDAQSGENSDEQTWASAGARLGRGLGGISELIRLVEVANVGKVAAQTARVVRVAETATAVLSGLFVAVDIFFIALDAKEIHNLRRDTASTEAQEESENPASITESISSQILESTNDKLVKRNTKIQKTTKKKVQELRTEIMKFVNKIRETKEELGNILEQLKHELQELQPNIPISYDDEIMIN